ncbi:hypothetical protein FMUND_15771 [Fusarium mundagurra]|uniref:Uncharacterized protein n=1 Tax=Fusarium mundagurra TaxID=1567541 RepID=A0A8H6CXT1_9HYPO|nr:hypothetical protein FMUND_15771 [Fusarium mundagurra]
MSFSATTSSMSSDIFHKLPPELHFTIVGNLRSLEDVSSFTSASPIARRYFHANQRTSFLRPYIVQIHENFGDGALVPRALTLLELRKVRAQTRGLTSLQIQQRLKCYLDDKTLHDDEALLASEPKHEWKKDLGCIIALTKKVLPGVASILESYRNEVKRRFSRIPWLAEKAPEIPSADRRILVDEFLRHDIYCYLFYNGDESLFVEKLHSSRKYRSCLPQHLALILRSSPVLISILELIKHRHREILDHVETVLNRHLAFCQTTSKRNERNQVQDTMRQGGPSTVISRRLKECRLETSYKHDKKAYIDYMCYQGYPVLQYLEQLELPHLKDYVIETFFKITTKKRQEKAGWRVTTRYPGGIAES